MNRQYLATYTLLLPAWLSLIPDPGCMMFGDAPQEEEVEGGISCRPAALPAPVVETTVAEPKASITRDGDRVIAAVENQPRQSFVLDMPQGHLLVIRATGHGVWSEGTQGWIGFHLTVRKWKAAADSNGPEAPIGDWVAVGSGSAAGVRTGESAAAALAQVPITIHEPGRHRIRAIVTTTVTPQAGDTGDDATTVVDQDTVEIALTVHAGPEPVCLPEPELTPRNDNGWLEQTSSSTSDP